MGSQKMIPEEIKDYYDILLLQTPRGIMGSDRNIKEFYNHPQKFHFIIPNVKLVENYMMIILRKIPTKTDMSFVNHVRKNIGMERKICKICKREFYFESFLRKLMTDSVYDKK